MFVFGVIYFLILECDVEWVLSNTAHWPVCVSYRIMRFPWQMSEDKVRHVLQEALGVWSAVTPLRFREVINEKADIIIDFNR